jgi:hypothetical protein
MVGDTEPRREAFPEGDGQWLTYAEIAVIRGIGRPSAVKLVQRERWRRIPGNERDRSVRVYVPAEWLKPAKEPSFPDSIPDSIPGRLPELTALFSQLEQVVALVRDRAEVAEARADQADTDRRAAEARTDAERARADELRAQLEAARREADELKRANAARRSESVWRRVRAALRGR